MLGTGSLPGQRVIDAIHTPHYKQVFRYLMGRADRVFLQLAADEHPPHPEFYGSVLIRTNNPLYVLPLSKADAVHLRCCSRDCYPKEARYAENDTFPHEH